jgi:hypothetical protein
MYTKTKLRRLRPTPNPPCPQAAHPDIKLGQVTSASTFAARSATYIFRSAAVYVTCSSMSCAGARVLPAASAAPACA